MEQCVFAFRRRIQVVFAFSADRQDTDFIPLPGLPGGASQGTHRFSTPESVSQPALWVLVGEPARAISPTSACSTGSPAIYRVGSGPAARTRGLACVALSRGTHPAHALWVLVGKLAWAIFPTSPCNTRRSAFFVSSGQCDEPLRPRRSTLQHPDARSVATRPCDRRCARTRKKDSIWDPQASPHTSCPLTAAAPGEFFYFLFADGL